MLLPDAAWLCKTSNRQSSVRLRIFKFLRALLSLACVHHHPPPQKKNKCFKIGNMSSNAEIEVPVCQELEKSLSVPTFDFDIRCYEIRLNGGCSVALLHPKFCNNTLEAKGLTTLNEGRFCLEMEIDKEEVPAFDVMFGFGTDYMKRYVRAKIIPGEEVYEDWSLSYQGLCWLGGMYFEIAGPIIRKGVGIFGLYLFDGYVSYFIDDDTVYTGLTSTSEPIFPIVGGTSTRSRICTDSTRFEVPSLQEFCRASILRHLNCEGHILELGLPQFVEKFLIKGLREAPRLRGDTPDYIFPYY